jgi:hypothetical protein
LRRRWSSIAGARFGTRGVVGGGVGGLAAAVAAAAAAAAAAGVLRPQFILAAGAIVALVVVVFMKFMAVVIFTCSLHVRWNDVRYLKINLKEN